MAYTCRSRLESSFSVEEISQLVDDARSPDDTLEQAIRGACSIIDGYLGALYQLPLVAPVPDLVAGIADDLARYRLWDDKAPAEVRRRYEDAIALLKDVSKGVVRLTVSPTVVPSTEYGGTIATTARTRTFSDDTLGSFVGRGDLCWPPRTD